MMVPNRKYSALEELVDKFSIDRVHKGGAKFDFEKAKMVQPRMDQKVISCKTGTIGKRNTGGK